MKLNLNSLNQTAGSIIKTEIEREYNSLIKVSTHPVTNELIMTKFDTNTYAFKTDIMDSLELFINFVLPFIKYKGKQLGYDSIKNIESLTSGSFGVTLIYDDILIKIAHSTFTTYRPTEHYREIKNLEIITKNYNIPKSKMIPINLANPSTFITISPPSSISKYFGFITTKKNDLLSSLNTYNGKLKNAIISNLFTNSNFTIDEVAMHRELTKIKKINSVSEPPFFEEMILIFLKKEDMNLTEFKNQIFIHKTPIQKIEILNKFLIDMHKALIFLHSITHHGHFDIKPYNIVVSIESESESKYIFKLIDFGGLSSIDSITGIIDPYENPHYSIIYNRGTFHETKFTWQYDYYCVLYSALQILGLQTGENQIVIDFCKKIKKVNIVPTLTNLEKIEYMIVGINTVFNVDFPSVREVIEQKNKLALNAYKLLYIMCLISPIHDGIIPKLLI